MILARLIHLLFAMSKNISSVHRAVATVEISRVCSIKPEDTGVGLALRNIVPGVGVVYRECCYQLFHCCDDVDWCDGILLADCLTLPCTLQVDARTPTAAAATWKLSADVEALSWNPHEPTNFLVSSEDGLVAAYDARAGAGEAGEEGGRYMVVMTCSWTLQDILVGIGDWGVLMGGLLVDYEPQAGAGQVQLRDGFS